MTANAKKYFRHFDWDMTVAFLVICAVGTMEIYYSTLVGGRSAYIEGHLFRIGFGCVICLATLLVNYRVIFSNMVSLYVFSIGTLVFVLFFGVEVRSARAWLSVGAFSVQPSEFVKIVVILTLAKFFSDHQERYLRPFSILAAVCITLLPSALIIFQHDLGTALTLLPVLISMLILAGVRRRTVVVSTIVGVALLFGGWHMLQKYQTDRIRVLIDLESDPQKTGYQTIQSIIAVGSGGFSGRGLGRGSQGAMGFLPEKHTDFIFSIVGEELGFVGGGGVLILYFVFIFTGFRVARETMDKRVMYASVGISTLFAVHLVLNVGMTLGMAPVVGIPLPPMSYGGSALLTSFAAVGLLNNFRIHREFI